MNTQKYVVMILLFCFAFTSLFATEIPKNIGNWRVEVGPPGNDFYKSPIPTAEVKPPTEEMLQIVKYIAPAYTEIKRWEVMKKDLYFIRAEAGPEEYDFQISINGQLYELEYENDSTNVEEDADKLIIKGRKKSISLNKVPQTSLKTLAKISPNIAPSQAWIASTIAGERYVIVVGDMVYYARPDGQIQAAGLIKRGALNEIEPSKKVEKSEEEILADAQTYLSKYRDKFNFEKQIKVLGKQPKSSDGQFRFIVMGDSRSNTDLWNSIIKHIDQLNPKPTFVINSGDIVRHGYAKEYWDYYVPPLLETGIPYFVAIGNHDDGDNAMAIEYRYLFGDNSLNYFFDYGKLRFIFVDNSSAVQSYEKTLNWLEQTLTSTPNGFSKIVAAHKPVANIEKWAYHAWDEVNSKIFTDLMNEYKVNHVFFGHIHAYSTAILNGIPYTISGGGGAGLHDRFGPLGNVHHYIICDVMPDGSIQQQVLRFYKKK